MTRWRCKNPDGTGEDIVVIEDPGMFTKDARGNWAPGFEFVNGRTVIAHPDLFNARVAGAERLWTEEEMRCFMRVLEVLPRP